MFRCSVKPLPKVSRGFLFNMTNLRTPRALNSVVVVLCGLQLIIVIVLFLSDNKQLALSYCVFKEYLLFYGHVYQVLRITKTKKCIKL